MFWGLYFHALLDITIQILLEIKEHQDEATDAESFSCRADPVVAASGYLAIENLILARKSYYSSNA